MRKLTALAAMMVPAMMAGAMPGGREDIDENRVRVRSKSTPEERMRRKGLRPFDIDGKTVWATNLKNAKRKA